MIDAIRSSTYEREVEGAVETVAENTVGTCSASRRLASGSTCRRARRWRVMYRAANTLDSMVGYRNDRYRWFGWASQGFDDLCNYLPARLTGLSMVGMSALHRQMSSKRALLAILCFAEKHPSPNSDIPEAAAAGAMGVELGGVNNYGGIEERSGASGMAAYAACSRPYSRCSLVAYGMQLWMEQEVWR